MNALKTDIYNQLFRILRLIEYIQLVRMPYTKSATLTHLLWMTSIVKDSIFADVISKLNAEVFTQKAGRLYPPVSQLLALEKKLALCTASLVKSVDIPDYKQLERLFWDNVNHTYGTGYFAEIPKWGSNIFIPLQVWESVLQPYALFYKNMNPEFNFYDFAFTTAALSAWRYSQPVLKLENDVYRTLLNDENGRYVDGHLLNYYFQWTNFIHTPGLGHNDKPLYGFFAHQNEVLFNGNNVKVLIIVFCYEDTEANISDEDALSLTSNWGDYVVLEYRTDTIKTIKDSLIGTNLKGSPELLILLGKMLSLFNFSIHPKTDIYNHRGYLMQPTYNDTIDSFLSSYRKHKGMPVRRGVGKSPSSNQRREVLYHVHAPSCPRLFDTGLNTGFVSRMHKSSHIANDHFNTLHWLKTDTGLKLISGSLYTQETETKLIKSIQNYFYGNNT